MAYDFLPGSDAAAIAAYTLGGSVTDILGRVLAPRLTGWLKRHDTVVSRAAILLNALDQAIIDGNPRLQGSWLDVLVDIGVNTLDGVSPAEVKLAANKALELYDAKAHEIKARKARQARYTAEKISGIADL